jgi:phage terminase Nu1 subunit (DNA packaging protein)
MLGRELWNVNQNSFPVSNRRNIGWHHDCVLKQGKNQLRELQGWQEIAEFLGLPVATAHRWEKSGMPVHRGGRYVYAMPDELNRWLGKESHAPIHISTEGEDLAADLKRALS